MGITYSIDAEARLVRLDCTGNVTLDAWAATMKAVFEDQRYEPGFGFLVDRRLALTPSVDYVRRAVAFAREHKRDVAGSRWALVVNNPAMFGMMRLGQTLASDLVKGSELFKNLEEAEHWLRSGQAPAPNP